MIHSKTYTEEEQGQGNQCQTPGVKFDKLTGWKRGKTGRKWKKQEETEKPKEKQDLRSKPGPIFFHFVDFF